MNGLIAWFTRNGVAANLLMFTVVFAGAYSLNTSIPTEVFPDFDLDIVEIGVDYRGATPSEVEEAVVVRVEESIQDLVGIKKISSSSAEGAGGITVEVEKGFDPRELLDDIKSRVDAITTFPDNTEKPTIRVAQRTSSVIAVVLSGQLNERELRALGVQVRDDIASLPGISHVSLGAVRSFEIAVEVSEETLQRHGLTFQAVSRAIANSSVDLPGGSIKTAGGEILLRTQGQAYVKEDFEKIVLMTRSDGTRLTLGDVAVVKDEFEETPIVARYNQEPCVLITVSRVGDQNAIDLAETVKGYMANAGARLPPGVKLKFWNDRSKIVKGRLDTLLRNALSGAVLVLLTLALFLRPMVAFWVFLGVPVAFMGSISLMPLLGVTFNIFSLFGFILVLGIVVDDAIVTGENIFTHLQHKENGLEAAIHGAQEVAVPVIFGVLTTVVAFVPLLMVEGFRGKIFAQIPLVIIPVLLFSLIESKLILPSHLKHLSAGRTDFKKVPWWQKIQRVFSDGLELFVARIYQPVLAYALKHRYVTMSIFLGVGMLIYGLVGGGRIKFVYFPRVDSETATARLSMPLGTPEEVTARHVERIEAAVIELKAKHLDPATGKSPIQSIISVAGGSGITSGRPGSGSGRGGQSHVGEVSFRVTPPEERDGTVNIQDLVREWRQLIGPIPGAKELNFRAEIGRGGDPLDIQLAGQSFTELSAAAEQIKTRLKTYSGVFDIQDSFQDGKPEIKLRIKPEAELLGLTMADLGRQARQAFFGDQAQRIQRGRDDIRVMVRYSRAERESLSSLEQMRIRTPEGIEVPFSAVAEVEMGRGFSTIRRVDRQRTISVTADVNKETADVPAIEADLEKFLNELVASHHGMEFRFEGESRERAESFHGAIVGGIILLFALYALLAIPFGSYVQPLIVMSVIPFGLIGAVLGHMIMGMSLSIMSIFGMLALAGVVVNDSLVLVDYVNKRRAEGLDIPDAIRTAGVARFRPIFLTSVTTFVGLFPLMFEKSTQAQFVIPMGVSLAYGVLFATVITLFLVPINYLVLEDIKAACRWLWNFELGCKTAQADTVKSPS